MSALSRLSRRGPRGRIAACIGGLALLAAACGGESSDVVALDADPVEAAADVAADDSSADDSSTTDDEAAAAPEGPSSVLVGEFDTLGGDTIDLASLDGQDVVLWFWAPW
jgi:hypothetical protein